MASCLLVSSRSRISHWSATNLVGGATHVRLRRFLAKAHAKMYAKTKKMDPIGAPPWIRQ